MTSLKRTLFISWVLMAGLIGALIGPQAIGFMQNGNAPSVVTVDIGQVMENLDQRADAMRRIEALRNQRTEYRAQWETKLKGLDAKFTAASESAAADDVVRTMRNDLVHHALRFESWMAYANERIDHEASLLMRDLYRSVQAELAVMAQASGFALVLRDDSIDDIPVDRSSKVPQEMQVMQAISSVQVLYTDDAADITGALVTRMNNAWKNSPREAQPPPTLEVNGLFDLP